MEKSNADNDRRDSGSGLMLTEWLAQVGQLLGLPITGQAVGQFTEFIRLLREWNEKFNLTAILDDQGIAIKHVLDSLTLLPYLDRVQASSPTDELTMIDVGSGAGFPGIPLKIMRPDLKILLLDSMVKRIRFLDEVIADLKLQGISTWHGRAEDGARDANLREKFQVATARAVAPLPALCEYCLPFVRLGGTFLAMKGPAGRESQEARRAIQLLGGELVAVDEFILPGTDIKRTIITIGKIAPTPAAYPRQAGKPETRPLI